MTSELEARWNKALARVGEIEAKIAKHRTVAPQPIPMSASQLVALAGNLRAVWTAPSTDARLKKRIVRTLIHEVVADLDDVASEIVLVIHWVGGVHTGYDCQNGAEGNETRHLTTSSKLCGNSS